MPAPSIPRLGDEVLLVPNGRYRAYTSGVVTDVRDHGTTLVITGTTLEGELDRYLDTVRIDDGCFYLVDDMPTVQEARQQLRKAAA